ncbi:isopenicillin N synthase-like dioxygenase [Sphingobacterium allocomposti]|jgi:isopenicillin N synthase-like dioxygenase|uniref:Isopenicillin N synthase-like dioxygenase n=1 Tax=Sphingobacterium allocomposti TaxID=415956 RepID=A0A5S5DK35_9SPHI|nr:2-oxoglutarate and iron-dependent oxygenase domain-containing protein [Sphingobacterium composti Yoo et al. 2007 non Ten et al. 2007]TYP95974.1 isopenicillin N synthase-like dioxygenase [Sphingobacterium composti Yoo et al. 2007 non Ten et al. 2007]HLS95319.1 2-oxoglutarate and iron-dependent oxygenase domain-containing protein [Sphingobacterium sp.]
MAIVNIPRLDLLQYTQGDSAQRTQFIQDIGKAFNETGFVTVANHGLSPELIDELYAVVKAFFDLPEAVKRKYEFPDLAGQRGYTSRGKEKAKDANTPDLKEFWQRGQTVVGEDYSQADFPDNIIVEELPRFNEVTAEVYKKLENTGRDLLKAIAAYLQLEEDYFEPFVVNGNSILRAIHYFPIENPDAIPDDAVRAGAHEDINLITLLIGASADGLEVLTKDGSWFPIRAKGEDIVVNVGDMLQRLTNNKLKSTTHRVVNPPRELMKTSRYSVPFFLHPKSSMSLACLDSCISEEHPKMYDDYTAGQYLDERLREIGLKM